MNRRTVTRSDGNHRPWRAGPRYIGAHGGNGKERDLTAPILGAETAERLIQTVFAIETVPDIRSLRPLLQRG